MSAQQEAAVYEADDLQVIQEALAAHVAQLSERSGSSAFRHIEREAQRVLNKVKHDLATRA